MNFRVFMKLFSDFITNVQRIFNLLHSIQHLQLVAKTEKKLLAHYSPVDYLKKDINSSVQRKLYVKLASSIECENENFIKLNENCFENFLHFHFNSKLTEKASYISRQRRVKTQQNSFFKNKIFVDCILKILHALDSFTSAENE